MAEKLEKFYADAKVLGGLKAQMRMAMITKIPGDKAKSVPDTPENIQIFEHALIEIRKEFKQKQEV